MSLYTTVCHSIILATVVSLSLSPSSAVRHSINLTVVASLSLSPCSMPFYHPYYSGIDITMPSIPISLVGIHNIDLIMAPRPVNLVSIDSQFYWIVSYRTVLHCTSIVSYCLALYFLILYRIVLYPDVIMVPGHVPDDFTRHLLMPSL